MKWFNHKHTAGAIAFAVTGNPVAVIPAILGSIIPDIIEGMPNEEDPDDYNKWRRGHRRSTHWFIPYLAVFAVLFLYIRKEGFSQMSFSEAFMLFHTPGCLYIVFAYLIGFGALGCLLHVAMDALCGKVPSVNPNKRVGMKIFRVGSLMEYIVALAITFSALQVKGVPVINTMSKISAHLFERLI